MKEGRLQFHVSHTIKCLQSRPLVIGTWGSPLLEQSFGLLGTLPQELKEKPLPIWKMMGRRNKNNALEVFIVCLAFSGRT